jgi:hypothetical protein
MDLNEYMFSRYAVTRVDYLVDDWAIPSQSILATLLPYIKTMNKGFPNTRAVLQTQEMRHGPVTAFRSHFVYAGQHGAVSLQHNAGGAR